MHASTGSARELSSSFETSEPETGTFRRPLAVAAIPGQRATRPVCHREDWSSVLRDKNLFSIMSEDTFLVRHRRASGLGELRAAQLFYRPLLREFIAGRQSELGGYLFVIPRRVHHPASPSRPPPPHQRLPGIISGPFAVMTCVYTPAKNVSNKAPAAESTPGEVFTGKRSMDVVGCSYSRWRYQATAAN